MKYSFLELIDINIVRLFMNSIYKITNIHSLIINTDGVVLVSSGNSGICSELNSVDFITKIKYLECEKDSFDTDEQGEYFIHNCKNGFSNIVSPIIINGCHLANLFTGDFLIEKMDSQYFKSEIDKNKFNLEKNIKVINGVNILTEMKLKTAISLHLQLARLLKHMCFNQIKQLEIQENLKLSELRYKLAVLGSNDIIWEWNMENDEFFISERWKEIIGYDVPKEYNFFKELIEIIYADDIEILDAALLKHIDGETPFFKCEYRIKIQNGSYKWILHRGKILSNDKGEHVRMAGSITDINYRKIYEEEIRYQLYYDYLTNLPNRSSFMKKLTEELHLAITDNDYKIALFFIDIDDFKRINDTFGHEIGDRVLIWAAENLNKFIQKQEMLFRLGGDEFVLVMVDYENIEAVKKKAKELINTFNDFIEIYKNRIYITLSIGISLFPENGMNVNELLKNADIAMYNAKNLGKNNYSFFIKSMNDEIKRKMKIEMELKEAIEKNEFILYYQPQININTMEVYGIEALIRWNHPKLGIVSPAYFIDIIEQNGMINTIGKFVLYEAFKEIKNLHDIGFKNLVMSVNVSVKQLEDRSFYDYFEKTLSEIGVDCKFINIEITEGILLKPSEIELNTLGLLRNKGVKVFIDDFGTKYSSLNYLYKLPIDGIKIDKSFIDEIKKSEKEFIVLKNIVRLADEINIDVIAEGVEYSEQLSRLKSINCEKIQGFIFEKPVEPGKIVDCLNKYKNI